MIPYNDFIALARAYLELCDGGDDLDAGIDIINKHIKVSDNGYYFEEEEE